MKAKGKPAPSSGTGNINNKGSVVGIDMASGGKFKRKKKFGMRSSSRASSPSPSFPLPDFVDVAPFDHERHCPRYCVLVSRSPDDDPTTSDELDPLQHELEQILLHNMKRQENIANQLSTLTDGEYPSTSEIQAESSKGRITPAPLILRRLQSDLVTATCSSPHPEAPGSSQQPKLKIRLPNPSTTRRPKPQSALPLGETNTSKASYAPVPIYDSLGRRRMYFWPQNHMPDKFWQFVSEHCDPIQEDDLESIKELLNENSEEKNSKFYRCPGLGKHYSLRWSLEDSKKVEMKSAGSKSVAQTKKRKLNSPDPTSGGESSDAERQKSGDVKRAKTRSSTVSSEIQSNSSSVVKNGHAGEHYCLGPLTERLVQALIEEGSFTQNNSCLVDFSEVKDIPEVNGMISPNKTLVKSLNLGNMAALERRIQKELEEQGLLNGDDDSDEEDVSSSRIKEEDEVTSELRLRQEELRTVCELNRSRLQRISEKMEKCRASQEIESQLNDTDKEVLNLYGKFYNLVPKRKPSSKKERDQLWKSLRERQKLVRKLDTITEFLKDV